jgi:hypothetical protein
MTDRAHSLELAAFFCFRLAELAARVTLLALFAVQGIFPLSQPSQHAQDP